MMRGTLKERIYAHYSKNEICYKKNHYRIFYALKYKVKIVLKEIIMTRKRSNEILDFFLQSAAKEKSYDAVT